MTKTRPLHMVPLKNDLIWPGGTFKPKNYLSLSLTAFFGAVGILRYSI